MEPWPEVVRKVDPPSPGPIGTVALVLAATALALYLVGALFLIVPVETPGVQRCGAPGAYLLAGRLDVVPDEEGRIRGDGDEIVTLDPDVAAAARERPCRERVAERGVRGGIALAAATVIGLAAFLLELLVVRPRQRRALRAAHAAALVAAPAGPEGPHGAPQGVPPGQDPGGPLS